MKCAVPGCPQDAPRECSECSRSFCDQHVEICNWCQAWVCRDCREEHESSSPLHESGESGG